MILEDCNDCKYYLNTDELFAKAIRTIEYNTDKYDYTTVTYVDGDTEEIPLDEYSHDKLVSAAEAYQHKWKENSHPYNASFQSNPSMEQTES